MNLKIIIIVFIACMLLVSGCVTWTIFTKVSVENTSEENMPIAQENNLGNNETQMLELGF